MLNKETEGKDMMEVESMSEVETAARDSNAVELSITPLNNVIGTLSNCSVVKMCAHLKARSLAEDADRAPIDIMVALDHSGSMAGRKLELCKSTLTLLLRFLLPHDRFGLVLFSSSAKTAIPLQNMTATNKEKATSIIRSVRAHGSTNISDAVAITFYELRTLTSPNEVQTIFLLSDGNATAGIRYPEALVHTVGNHAKGSLASLFCFGYGDDHDSNLMRRLSDTTQSGSYYYVKDDSDVGSAFGEALGGVLSVLAQSIVLKLSPCDATTSIPTVYHDHAVCRDDGSFTVQLGDLFAEEERDVLFDVTLAPNPSETVAPIPHVAVELFYTDVIAKQPVVIDSIEGSVTRPVDSREISPDDPHVAAQWLRVVGARALQAASEAADQGDLGRARQQLEAAQQEIQSAPAALLHVDFLQQMVSDLRDAMGGLASREKYRRDGSKFMKWKQQTHQTQRAADAKAAASTYGTSGSARCKAKMKTFPA